MKHLWAVIGAGAIVVAGLVALGCATMQKPDTEPNMVWNYITEENDYTDWAFYPEAEGMVKGGEPHGAWIKTYVNSEAMNSKMAPVKDGSIIVKENYTPDRDLAAITVMYKVKGYNPDAGDWYWAKYQPDGSVDAEGKVKGCIDCHGQVSDNDYVFTHQYGEM